MEKAGVISSFAPLVKHVMPTVVNVSVVQKVKGFGFEGGGDQPGGDQPGGGDPGSGEGGPGGPQMGPSPFGGGGGGGGDPFEQFRRFFGRSRTNSSSTVWVRGLSCRPTATS